MPHDRNGQKLEVGDTVKIPVSPIRIVQVQGNDAAPNEYTPQITVLDGAEETIEGKVVELYEAFDACNAEFEIVGALGRHSFNTRLVEKVTVAAEAVAG